MTTNHTDLIRQLREHGWSVADAAADALEAMQRQLHEISEEWAGAECGEPVTAQEAYAIELAKRMYRLAVEGTDKPVADDALPEPVAYMWMHDETGRIGFVDVWQLENGWQQANPRCQVENPLFTADQLHAAIARERAKK